MDKETESTLRRLDIGRYGGPARISSEICLDLQCGVLQLQQGDKIEAGLLNDAYALAGEQVRTARKLVLRDIEENRQHLALLDGFMALQRLIGEMLQTATPPGEKQAA